MLCLVAREHSIRQLEGMRASKSRGHEAFEFAAFGKLSDDTLQHSVTDDRTRELLRQRTGESAVEDAGDLRRRQDLVHRLFERPAPSTRGCPCWEESGASGCVGESGALLVVLGCHHEKYRPRWRACCNDRAFGSLGFDHTLADAVETFIRRETPSASSKGRPALVSLAKRP
jgi:hypothetical protein